MASLDHNAECYLGAKEDDGCVSAGERLIPELFHIRLLLQVIHMPKALTGN
jgi:hypothetical protein